METRLIKVYYQSVDNCRKSRTFRTVIGARRFAQHYVGETPEIGSSYAVSGDGVGTIRVSGATLLELFPKCDDRQKCAYQDCQKPLPGPYGTPGVSSSRVDGTTLVCSECGVREALEPTILGSGFAGMPA